MSPTNTQPQIGLQLYTIRDLFAAGSLDGPLAEVAAIGYRNVELVGLYGRPAEEVKAALDRHGLTAVSAHEPLQTLESDLDGVIGRAKLFGYDLVAVPWLDPGQRTAEHYRVIAGQLPALRERLAAEGITLMWHNHDFEFYPMPDGEIPEDLLLATGVLPELDLYWTAYADLDPQDLMIRYSGRLPILHVKDMRRGEKNFAEVGTGVLDLPLYVREAASHGVRYLIVEQDSNWTVSPLESARVGFQNLSRMLAAG
jgi:sugar phosphate isomerase/epimerase